MRLLEEVVRWWWAYRRYRRMVWAEGMACEDFATYVAKSSGVLDRHIRDAYAAIPWGEWLDLHWAIPETTPGKAALGRFLDTYAPKER